MRKPGALLRTFGRFSDPVFPCFVHVDAALSASPLGCRFPKAKTAPLLVNNLCNDECGLADNAADASLAEPANERSTHGFTLLVIRLHYYHPQVFDGFSMRSVTGYFGNTNLLRLRIFILSSY